MTGAGRWGARVVIALGMLASVVEAAPALDKPSFTATPAELLATARSAPRASTDVIILREDNDLSYDERGRLTTRWRMVFVVTTQAGASDWNVLSTTWLPAYQDRPTVRARVIDPNGGSVELDPARITDSPVGNAARASAADRRRLEVPLPPLVVGAIVEEQVTTVDREPLLGIGGSSRFDLSSSVAQASVRARISAPAKQKLRVLAFGLPKGAKPRTERVGGRQVMTYAFGALPQRDDYEGFVPGDARPYPYIASSVVASWNQVARGYRALVDKRIAEGPFATPAGLPTGATLATVRALVSWLHGHVQYSGTELDDAGIVPATPADTAKRGWGDAKDMAVLLLALLRQAGVHAELALINIGPGPDIDRDLPSFAFFDHVIVRAHVGNKELWIDPIEPLTAPGQLPSHDRGRFALVVADTSTALIATPSARAADNLVREVRTFDLAELGAAQLTEVSSEGGAYEADQRQWIRDTTADEVRKGLVRYVESEYKGTFDHYTAPDPNDLDKPFEVTVVANKSSRGYTERGSIDVYLFRTDVLEKLPKLLSDPEDGARKRTYDLALFTPHTYEIENRLVVPAGFTLPPPATPLTRDIGPWKLTETQRVDGRAFVVTFRFETSKVRLTPTDVEQIQQAIRELGKEDARHIVFPLAGFVLAEAGKYKDAIAEIETLIKLHPKEALHHEQLAHVLIKAGAGDAAHRAARRAVALEPKNADAYTMLGWALQFDSFGTWLGRGHDHAAARTALEKAHKLDPKHVGAAADLAAVLERSPRGRRFGPGSDVRAAIAAWRDAYALDPTVEHGYSLASALLWAGEGAEAEKLLRTMATAERRDQLLVAAVAIARGAPAAIREAGVLGTGSARTQYLTAAGSLLFVVRRYDLMRALLAELSSTQLGPMQPELIKQIARFDKPFKRGKQPGDAALALALDELDPGRAPDVYWDASVREDLVDERRASQAVLARNELMTETLIVDIMRSTAKVTVDGDAGLWRVELDELGHRAHVYVAADRGTPKVIGTDMTPAGAGRHALRLLAKNNEKQALRLLDWVGKDIAARNDVLAHHFASVWGANLPRARKDIELAAAVLTGTTDAAHAIPILARCAPTTTDGQLACDASLAELYEDTHKWIQLEDHARAWITRAPKQIMFPTVMLGYALAHQGRFDDADRLLADAIAKDPDDLSLTGPYSDFAVARGKLDEAVRRLEPVTKRPAPRRFELNNLAWLKLVEGSDLPGAAALARQAFQLDKDEPHTLNTLAAIEVELGELGDARAHLLGSIRGNALPQPDGADVYVHARLLEQLGLRDDAIALYRTIKRPTGSGFVPGAFELAAIRLKALGVKKK